LAFLTVYRDLFSLIPRYLAENLKIFCGTLVGKHLYNHWTKCDIREDLDHYLLLVLRLFACQHTFEVLELLKEKTMNMIMFESMTLCNLSTLKMEATGFFEIMADFYQTT
jgi:hypothetical protein